MRACSRIHSVFLVCFFDQLSSCHDKLPCYLAFFKQLTYTFKLFASGFDQLSCHLAFVQQFSGCVNKLSCDLPLIEQHSKLSIELQYASCLIVKCPILPQQLYELPRLLSNRLQ